MFYSTQILSRKGNLGLIWIAASVGEKKLKKSQVFDIDVVKSAERIIDPEDRVPLALRLSGQLLLGVVRIYLQKVKFLFDDCESVLEAIKQAFRTQAVTLHAAEKGGVTVHRATITLPETLVTEGALDPALLPLELNLELNDFRPGKGEDAPAMPSKGRRISLDPSRTTRRHSLTEFDLNPRSPGGSLAHAFDFDPEGLGLGEVDLGITPQDIEIETERLRTAKQQRSSERRTLELDYDYQGGGAGGYEGYVEPEVLREGPGPRTEARLSLGAASPASAIPGLRSRERERPALSGQASPAGPLLAGRRSLPGSGRKSLEGQLDDLLPPGDVDAPLEAALLGALPLEPMATGGGLKRKGTPAASPAPSARGGAGAEDRQRSASPAVTRRVLRKRKLQEEERTTLAGAQIKALMTNRAPLMSRRGRKARVRAAGEAAAAGTQPNARKGAAAAAAQAPPPTPSAVIAAEAVALLDGAAGTGTTPARRGPGADVADLLAAQEDGPVARLFQELVRERTEAVAGPTPGRQAAGGRRQSLAAVREGEEGAGPSSRTPRRAKKAGAAEEAVLAAVPASAGGEDANAAPFEEYDYLGGGGGEYEYAELRPRSEEEEEGEEGAAGDGEEPRAKRPRTQEEGAGPETSLNARSKAFLAKVRTELKKLSGARTRGGGGKSLSLKGLASGKGRAEAARMFYECLVLKAHGQVELTQTEPYGDILIGANA